MYRRIRDLREDSDLTQREMGEILHCSQRVYSNYERGDLDIPTDILIKLAKFHHVSTDYLLGLTNQAELVVDSNSFSISSAIISLPSAVEIAAYFASLFTLSMIFTVYLSTFRPTNILIFSTCSRASYNLKKPLALK